jgi:serine protease Do
MPDGQQTVETTEGTVLPSREVEKENERLRRENARLRRAEQEKIEKLRRENARLRKENQSRPKTIAKRPQEKKSPPPKSGTTGSGFFVSKLGHIVTNEHVVRKCRSVTVGDNANKQVAASVLEMDKRNDLALLRISSTTMASAETQSLISKLGVKKLGIRVVPLASGGLMRSNDIELGEKVLVAGFPYGELYSNTIKVTGGMVSAVKGMGDNIAQFQIDAAVQPGNSGGPIYDENGNIVGVVFAQLNKFKVAKAIGSLPENVNFGIKASTVTQFLTSAGLPTKSSNRTEQKTTRELAKIAKNQTVMVVCHR